MADTTKPNTQWLKKLHKNTFYEDTDVPALVLVSKSKSLFGVVFWYTIFITFGTICAISIYNQYIEFSHNPTQTDVSNVRAARLPLPNISICLTGWTGLGENVVWSPGFDSPTWPMVLSHFVSLELKQMESANGTKSILTSNWPYFVFLYTEYYVRSLMKIELYGEEAPAWWQTMEASVLNTFQPYGITVSQLMQKYASEILRMSSCANGWPPQAIISIWPFVDPREVNDRCLYIVLNITVNQVLTNRLYSNTILHSCEQPDFLQMYITAINRARVLASFEDYYSEPEVLYNVTNLVQCNGTIYTEKDNWCNGQQLCPYEKGLCVKCTHGAFSCHDGVCIRPSKVCNGVQDCDNGLDELNCTKTADEEETQGPSTSYLCCCGESGKERCPFSARCNGIIDCYHSHEDELNCTQCSGFSCGNGQCIRNVSKCNSLFRPTDDYTTSSQQCYNGKDETDECDLETESRFICAHEEKRSLEITARCNGTLECTDGSDEANCEERTYQSYCNSPLYTKCNDSSANCFLSYPQEESQRCDGIAQCANGMDEYDCEACRQPLYTCDKTINNNNRTEFNCYSDTDICNGFADCTDGTDEQRCGIRKCNERQFQCADTSCIDLQFRCDGNSIPDCADNSDELNCPSVNDTCAPNELRCPFVCIPIELACDGVTDCRDNYDEEFCPQTIPDDQPHFSCGNGIQRTRVINVCDGHKDCADGSDEKHCEPGICETLVNTTSCADKVQCIPNTYLCDNTIHCDDGSDQANCTCDKDHFECIFKNVTICLNQDQVCDDIQHCDNMSDERQNCNSTSYFPCANQLIPLRSVCDTEEDCDDGRDEWNCTYYNCSNGILIKPKYQCDGDNDCDDGGDEDNCPPMFNCEGRLINMSSVCDDHVDCTDGSDEFNCTNNASFQCADMQRTIHNSHVCNKIQNCIDGSDEQHCPCNITTEFSCDNGTKCIHLQYICDGGKPDRADGTDEPPTCTCKDNKFMCVSDRQCVSQAYICDGEFDCPDASDEKDCLRANATEFNCASGGSISVQFLCNGITDCPVGEDEKLAVCNPVNVNLSMCDYWRAILPTKCAGGQKLLSAHSDTCLEHRMPWRQPGVFRAAYREGETCDGVAQCDDGVDELTYVCGNRRIAQQTRAKHMRLAADPYCVLPGAGGNFFSKLTKFSDKNLPPPPAYYYSRKLPVSLSDCIEACVYLSKSNINIYVVDIGLTYKPDKDTTWMGRCSAVRYNLTSNMCELIGECRYQGRHQVQGVRSIFSRSCNFSFSASERQITTLHVQIARTHSTIRKSSTGQKSATAMKLSVRVTI